MQLTKYFVTIKPLQITARVLCIYFTTIELLLIKSHLLHVMVGEFYQCMLNNECMTLSLFIDDILENVDESTIPDTLVQRLQEEK